MDFGHTNGRRAGIAALIAGLAVSTGALAVVVGYYYWSCASSGAVVFFKASVRGRCLFAVLVVALVAVFQAPLQLLLFAALDLAGAAWTRQALRQPL